jgi:DNA invertase Pin-like site-specific DNA recombinase
VTDQPIVVYDRVSTEQQKRSGLGLLAQQDSVRRYIAANPGRAIAELTEIESRRSKDRPQLKEAPRLCRVYNAKLIIAGLLESGVDFVAADMPHANRFTIHILAAVAEYEARLISERTRAAFAAAKARGRKFGGPNPLTQVLLRGQKGEGESGAREVQAASVGFSAASLPVAGSRADNSGNRAASDLHWSRETARRQRLGHSTVRRMFEHAGERKPKARYGRRREAAPIL